MKNKFKNTTSNIGAILGTLFIIAGVMSFTGAAYATTYMTHASVIEYNMVTGGSGNVAVAFTAGAADPAGTLTVNFNGWTGGAAGAVNATQTITTVGCQALTGATNVLPTTGTLSAAGATSIVTVSAVNILTSGQSYCFILNAASAVTNPTAAGQSKVTITDSTDTTNVEIDNIASDTIIVSAIVPPSFTLSLSGTTDSFASNLSTGSTVVTTGVTATINTNATSGWGLWAKDSNAGLTSATESSTIATVATGSNHTFTANSNQYGLGVATDPTTNYAYGGGTTGGGLSTSTYNQIATSASPASGVTTVLHELADIGGATPAAQDYTDTITVVGAGSF